MLKANGIFATRDYRKLYALESYLFDEVSQRFQRTGQLDAFDFFAIVVWKANRSKSKIAARLLGKSYVDLQSAVSALIADIQSTSSRKNQLRILMEQWKLRLPMSSAILSVLYPANFTIYDTRVCGVLNDFQRLGSLTSFERIWTEYERYCERVHEAVNEKYSLRDKDRYLWGKSFALQLEADIKRGFKKNLNKTS